MLIPAKSAQAVGETLPINRPAISGATIDAIEAKLWLTPKTTPCSFGPTSFEIIAESAGLTSPEPMLARVAAASAVGMEFTNA